MKSEKKNVAVLSDLKKCFKENCYGGEPGPAGLSNSQKKCFL